MKKYYVFTLISLLLSLSCKSNSDDTVGPYITFVKAQIDGNVWNASAFNGSYINSIVSIEALANDNTKIEISVQNVTEAGSYNLGNISIATYEEGNGNDETYTTAGTLGNGTISFTTINSAMAIGSFSFIGGNGLGESKNITDGSFEINLSD